jgi:pimeloyl-ACP methyl ester carboxylesterase
MPMLARSCGDISYQIHGDGPAVLLSHGYGATSAMFDPNLPALAGHQVFTWDLRGHGASQSPADLACYSAASARGDMEALLDEHNVVSAVLGGHSLGGYLSLSFTLAFPDLVRALILIGTGPGFRKDDARKAWNQRSLKTADRLAEQGLAALGSGSELGAHTDVQGLILAAKGTLTQHDAHVMDGLADIRVPALVVVGEHDTHFLAAADYMAAKIPAARKVVIPGAGHAPNIDQPDAFNAELRAFLAELPS